jgi:hypothetical protein
VRRLAAALAPFMADYQPVLLFDAAKPHLAPAVFAACANGHVWPVVVPAKMTWLLQPLDTHAFLLYKIFLQKAYQAARVESACCDISMAELLPCVYDGIRTVLEGRSWAYAFDADGFSPAQSAASDRVLVKLLRVQPLGLSAERPTLEQLRLCFPLRARVPAAAIWRPFDRLVPVAGAKAAAPAASLAATAPATPATPALRRSARVAARAACAALGGPPPRASLPSSSASSAVAASPPPPKAPAVSSGGIMTRSRTRLLRGT